jgi:hypothetical protein
VAVSQNHVEKWPVVFEVWNLRVLKNCFQIGLIVRLQVDFSFVISGFRRDVDEICALLRHYAASSSNPLPTFRDNLSVPFSSTKISFLKRR